VPPERLLAAQPPHPGGQRCQQPAHLLAGALVDEPAIGIELCLSLGDVHLRLFHGQHVERRTELPQRPAYEGKSHEIDT